MSVLTVTIGCVRVYRIARQSNSAFFMTRRHSDAASLEVAGQLTTDCRGAGCSDGALQLAALFVKSHCDWHVVAIQRPLANFSALTSRAMEHKQLTCLFVHLHAHLGAACEVVFNDDHLVLLRLFSQCTRVTRCISEGFFSVTPSTQDSQPDAPSAPGLFAFPAPFDHDALSHH